MNSQHKSADRAQIYLKLNSIGRCMILMCICAATSCGNDGALRAPRHAETDDVPRSAGAGANGDVMINETEAIAIATAHLRKLVLLPTKYEVTAREKDDGAWDIAFVSAPATPGDFVHVTVAPDGTPTGPEPGE